MTNIIFLVNLFTGLFVDFLLGSDGLHYGIMGKSKGAVSRDYCKNTLGMHAPFILTQATMDTLVDMAATHGS